MREREKERVSHNERFEAGSEVESERESAKRRGRI